MCPWIEGDSWLYSGIFSGGRVFIESEYFIEYKFCFFLSVTVGYRTFGPTNPLKPIDIPDLEGTKPPPPLENTPLVLCTGGGEYTFDIPRGEGRDTWIQLFCQYSRKL